MRFLKASLSLALPFVLGALISTRLPAQAPAFIGKAARDFETRAQLDAQAKNAEQQGRTSEAWLLRARLQQGDFQEGDRIVVTMGTNPPWTDTMHVRAGKVLPFGGVADIPLEGVLRSELTETLRQHLGKYYVNPVVRTTPLLPIAVFGNVGAPGYYYFPADALLRDLLMVTGGYRAGDFKKAIVRRGTQTIWDANAVSVALTDGLSLDRLHLRAGDEVYVPSFKRPRTSLIFGALSMTLTMFMLFNNGSRIF